VPETEGVTTFVNAAVCDSVRSWPIPQRSWYYEGHLRDVRGMTGNRI
jgi:hypothetical protein